LRQIFDQNKVGPAQKSLSEEERAFRKDRQSEAKAQANPLGKKLIEAGFAKPNGQDWKALTVIGPVAAKAIVDWAASDLGRRTLAGMESLGLAPQGKPASSGRNDQPLAGKTFVLTGTLPTLKRDEAAALIRQAGGDVTGSVSKNTNVLLAGENAGSKLDKARALQIQIMSEPELLALLDAAAPNTAT
jgi:DNA ligase (NAD+)